MLRPDRELRLQRFPLRHDEPLQAWDAADEYLLNHLDETTALIAGMSLLIVNDAFGALGVALQEQAPVSWSDSHLARLALEHNLERNGAVAGAVGFVPGDQAPSGSFDLVLIKIPKSLAWLEDLLRRLRPHLHAESQVVAGGMIKHTPVRAYRLLERLVGPTTTSLGWKKARLAFSKFDPALDILPAPDSSTYRLEEFDLELNNRPNVFAREGLDIGTRLLLAHLPQTDWPLRVADLGCGNGALGLAVLRRCPAASVLFVDESYQAVACARENAEAAGLDGHEFLAADGLREREQGSLDLILCNPPFHQAQAVDDLLAWRMFEQSRRTLMPGGELLVVGNRHLGYHIKLQRLFGNVDVVGSDRKFVVLRARR